MRDSPINAIHLAVQVLFIFALQASTGSQTELSIWHIEGKAHYIAYTSENHSTADLYYVPQTRIWKGFPHHNHHTAIYLPRAHAQGVKQSVCMSVVVVVRTKIASLGVLGP